MMNEPKAVKEIHDIRKEIFEETKTMTPDERANFAHNEAQKLIKQYDLKSIYENNFLK